MFQLALATLVSVVELNQPKYSNAMCQHSFYQRTQYMYVIWPNAIFVHTMVKMSFFLPYKTEQREVSLTFLVKKVWFGII